MLRRAILPAAALAALFLSPAAAPSGAGAAALLDPGGGGPSGGDQQGAGTALDPGATCASTHTFGSGNTLFKTCFTVDGNVVQFQVGGTGGPYEHIRGGVIAEGYVLCSSSGVSGYDTSGISEAGFSDPVVVQPGGPGTFPLTITRTTTDLRFSLKQKFTASAARVVTVTMTVTNTHGALLTGVKLARIVDADVDNTYANDSAVLTHRAATMFDNPGGGYLTLAATTRGKPVSMSVGNFDGSGASTTDCADLGGAPIYGPDDGMLKAVYDIGSIGKDASRDLVFTLTGD